MASDDTADAGLTIRALPSPEHPNSRTMTSLDNLPMGNDDLGSSNAQRRSSPGSMRNSSHKTSTRYDLPDSYTNLDELATPSPVQNPDEDPLHRRVTLEEARRLEQEYANEGADRRPEEPTDAKERKEEAFVLSRFVTQLYTISDLILFAILGTLARLSLQTLTFYPGAPVVFSELWANFGGCLIMGFLSEDRMLFREEWGTPKYDRKQERAIKIGRDQEDPPHDDEAVVDLVAAKKAHAATKKTIPLYIGLATGFCGSFTSFSSFIRDVFLALSNDLPTPLNHPGYPSITSVNSTIPRNGGYSFMAVLAIIIVTISSCICGLHIGAHLAIAVEPHTPVLSFALTRKFLDPFLAFIAWGSWLGAILLAIFPPDRHSTGPEIWRGRAVFALVLAPLGCLTRFFASLYLNGKIASFPLGTFVVNILGTMVLAMAWDLQHVPLGGVVGCQVLQGIEDGFCGCLTTVSTWVSELNALKRSHAYKYGAASVLLAVCSLVMIMGSFRWTRGFDTVFCTR